MADQTPPVAAATRAPQRKMTDDDKAALLKVLQNPACRVNGHIHPGTVCKLTGLSYNQVERFLKNDPYWKAQQAEANPGKIVPTEAQLMNGTGHPPPRAVPRTPEQAALFRQSDIISRKAWAEAGLSDLGSAMMERHGVLGRQPLGDLITCVSGGLVADLTQLNLKLEKLGDQLLNRDKSIYGDLPKIIDREGNDVTEIEWERVRLAMLAEKRAVLGAFVKTQVSIQTAERIFRDVQGNNNAPKAPFGGKPLQVVAQPGSSVLIQQNSNGRESDADRG